MKIEAEHVSIPIVGYGDGWMALNKPDDLSVHNEPGRDVCSLLNAYCMDHDRFAATVGFRPSFGFHAVHRLDRATSGIILLACRNDVLSFLGSQFQDRSVKKTYHAVCHGLLEPPSGPEETWRVWEWPLTRKAAGRKNPQGSGDRHPCRTQYRPLRQTQHYTHVALEPQTGRRHQLRRHATLSGHSVVGDKRYGSGRSVKYLKQRHRFNRLGLHAVSLVLRVPEEETPRTITTVAIPSTMQRLLDEDDR